VVDDPIFAGSAVDAVVALAAVEEVVASAAVDAVVAGPAVAAVVARTAVDAVVAPAAADELVAGAATQPVAVGAPRITLIGGGGAPSSRPSVMLGLVPGIIAWELSSVELSLQNQRLPLSPWNATVP
jgi:hypothetical protein